MESYINSVQWVEEKKNSVPTSGRLVAEAPLLYLYIFFAEKAVLQRTYSKLFTEYVAQIFFHKDDSAWTCLCVCCFSFFASFHILTKTFIGRDNKGSHLMVQKNLRLSYSLPICLFALSTIICWWTFTLLAILAKCASFYDVVSKLSLFPVIFTTFPSPFLVKLHPCLFILLMSKLG